MNNESIRVQGAGRVLENLRGERTRKQVAMSMGIDETTLLKIEHNQRGLSADNIVRFAEAIGQDPYRVFKACLSESIGGMPNSPGGRVIEQILDTLSQIDSVADTPKIHSGAVASRNGSR